jgi:hypothetical protein
MKVLTLVERDGKARSFHVASVNAETLKPILVEQIAQDASLMTDEAAYYIQVGKRFASHGRVNHGTGEYGRGPIHTNTVESYFSLLKRGLYGTFHHVSPKHLRRYVGEFDFRWNTRKMADAERARAAMRGIEGKRLFYRDSPTW